MFIRNMEIEDMYSLSELYFQFWNEKSNVEKMKNKFMQLQKNNSYIFLCAIEQEQLVGSIMGIICEELYGECQPFIVVENMIVDNEYRNKGIGKSLFYELENKAKEKGCTQIILVTEVDRKDACGFYESLGFSSSANKGYKKKLL